MRYDPIDKSFFVKNRKKFLAKMSKRGLAFFNSNDNYPVSADTTLPFEQHRDIFYLTGINQNETILALYNGDAEGETLEMLFVTKPNKILTHWEGERLDETTAFKISGIEKVYWIDDLEKKIDDLMVKTDFLYINNNEHYRAKVETETREERFNKWIQKKFPKKSIKKSNPILQRLRL